MGAQRILLVLAVGFLTVILASEKDASSSSSDVPDPETYLSNEKFGPGFMLPSEFLTPTGQLKPQILLPEEFLPGKVEPLQAGQALPAAAVENTAHESPDESAAPINEGPSLLERADFTQAKTTENDGDDPDPQDITLALNPEGSDLEFRYENASSKVEQAQIPNFTGQIFTLSYAGVKKPVLVVQPDVKQVVKKLSSSKSQSKNSWKSDLEETESSSDSSEASIPNFNIHFPLQTNSQFQIPKFNFTLPTLVLPGLVFTQNENVQKNTHELHVSIPQSDPSEYEQFPMSHVPVDFELIPHAPKTKEKELLSQAAQAEGAAKKIKIGTSNAQQQKPSPTNAANENIIKTPPAAPDSKKSAVPHKGVQGTNNNKGSSIESTPSIISPAAPIKPQQVPPKTPQGNSTKFVPKELPKPEAAKLQNVTKLEDLIKNNSTAAGPALLLEATGQKVPLLLNLTEGATPAEVFRPLPQLISQSGNNFPLLGHLATNGYLPSFPPPLNAMAPNFTSFAGAKWKFPNIGQLYNRWFGGGGGGGGGVGGSGRREDDCEHQARTEYNEEDQQDDPTLCGMDGLCGATCNRLGFYAGRCVDSSSCVCLLKQRPEFGLKLEYYVDRRARMGDDLFPAFGLCHNSACRINCEISGYVTGLCDSTCYCGLPWAENMSQKKKKK